LGKTKVTLIIFYLFIALGHYGLAQTFSPEQQIQIDSLNAIINNPSVHDTSLASAYVGLSDILYVSDIDTMNILCLKAKTIAEKALESESSPLVKHSLLISLANALGNMGFYAEYEGDIVKALEYDNQSLEIFEELGDKLGMETVLNNMGYIFKVQGDIDKALEYYHLSLKITIELVNKRGEAYLYNNIGRVYEDQGDLNKALEYHHKSLKIREEIDDKRGIAQSLNNIGLVYFKIGDSEKELEYYNKSLKISEENEDRKEVANTKSNLGNYYLVWGDNKKALEYLQQSLVINEDLNYKNGVTRSLSSIARVYMAERDLQKAKVNANKSLEMAKELGFPKRISEAAKLLSEIYKKENKGMQALEMHKLYIVMRDSINNKETQKATAQQQAKYEYEKQKVIDDAENDKLLAIEKEKKQKQQIFTAATSSILGLVIVFLYFVFNRLKVTRKQKRVIEAQKEEVEKQRDVIEHTHKEITDSIEYAKRIQGAILPPARIVKKYLEDSFIFYLPKDVVAGDFYWMRHKDDKILFAVADCTGHGVPGAMVSVVCNNALNRAVREYGLTDPGEILDKTRTIVVREFEKSDEEVKDGMDIALCTLEGNKLQYAGAYNPLWIIRDGELMETKANRYPIGLSRDPQPYTTHSIDLEKGDIIYIFTDGLVDQFGGEKGKKLKVTGFKKLLLNMHDKPMEKQRKLIAEAFYNWKRDLEQVDDICLIGVRI
jgi:serine phosphatase RsbU (regulator of sigma subunit)